MDYAEFIFVKRKLASDQSTIVSNLERSKKDNRPLWLLVYPEGTSKY
jgi:1-acyl-sn-glycerol-3-phosphate acyltransferase